MEKYFLQSLGPSLYRGSTVLENAVGINIIGTLLYCWVVMYSVYRAPKRTLWQRPHLVPVHGDGVWYSLGTSVNTCGWFLLSTHARIIGQCPSTRSRPCFRALTRYAPNPSVYTSFFLFYFFIFGVINRFALPAKFVYELKFRNGICQGEIKYL